eukprot:TRINITY_DN13449_c0_g1_i2.p1 TRINITY_DN13449_c0_g1~~TRINITY_DN13449_c0_g1_i2.p1  ORF type:complete len:218 (+),score=29.71 TRINITY_DN13449_c0_g1_i2:59-655(+)
MCIRDRIRPVTEMTEVLYCGFEEYSPKRTSTFNLQDVKKIVFPENERSGKDHRRRRRRFKNVVCGHRFTCLIEDNGALWLFGESLAEGLRPLSRNEYPIQVSIDGNACTGVFPGNNSLMIRTENRKIYSWGSSLFYKLGVMEGFIDNPTPIENDILKHAVIDIYKEQMNGQIDEETSAKLLSNRIDVDTTVDLSLIHI